MRQKTNQWQPPGTQNGLVSNKRFCKKSYLYFILFFVLLKEQANLLKITNIVSSESCARVNTKRKT